MGERGMEMRGEVAACGRQGRDGLRWTCCSAEWVRRDWRSCGAAGSEASEKPRNIEIDILLGAIR